eukprot:1155812-Pelagomonas_calceolata.AAC.3
MSYRVVRLLRVSEPVVGRHLHRGVHASEKGWRLGFGENAGPICVCQSLPSIFGESTVPQEKQDGEKCKNWWWSNLEGQVSRSDPSLT